jgi:hypothetical protein
MRTWLALIVTPSLALAVQSVMYALVTPMCATQTRVWVHLAAGGALLASAVLAVMAWSDWAARARSLPGSPDSVHGDPSSNRRFLAAVATGVAALSLLVILAMWIGAWMLSPCSDQ